MWKRLAPSTDPLAPLIEAQRARSALWQPGGPAPESPSGGACTRGADLQLTRLLQALVTAALAAGTGAGEGERGSPGSSKVLSASPTRWRAGSPPSTSTACGASPTCPASCARRPTHPTGARPATGPTTQNWSGSWRGRGPGASGLVFDLRHPRGILLGSIGVGPAPYGRLSELLGRVLMLRASRREDRKRVPQYSSP